ncbi:glycosyltransferase family 4 protein [Geomonas edaphica]|uniref:glycosyltransferase family 4 protein n=1 Tax=Geomonas edaphica TaxID=2570226 RepID=UPI001FE97344|nr:glycosyltransferase family 4 protein [Geomonas edaphica]
MTSNLLKELARNPELRLDVLLLNEGRLASELRSAGLTVTVLDENRHGFRSLLRQVRARLEKGAFQLIHSHRYKENLLAFLGNIGGKARLIATLHGLPEPCGTARPVHALKARANFFLMRHFFDRTVAVSEDIREHLVGRLDFPGSRVAVVHNGIPVLSHRGIHKKDAGFCIGSSGRLVDVKDYPLMVEVASLVCHERDVAFRLAGEGPCREEILAAVMRHGLEDRFILTGHLDHMEGFYQALDLYLNTSRHEGVPMTILEAMACGVPIVAPAVGGIGEIVTDGVEGLLAEGREPAALARRCIQLLDNAQLRKEMSLSAHRRAISEFSVERMAENYHRIYRELLA